MIPIEIRKVRDPDGAACLRAVVSLEDAFRHSTKDVKLTEIENKYTSLIQKCKTYVQKIRRSRENMSSSKLQWELADTVYTFIDALERSDYFFANAIPALFRDTGISKSQLNYLIKFRRYYPDINAIHQEINWSKYREMLDISSDHIRGMCEEKILKGEIKTDNEIREFKKSHRR